MECMALQPQYQSLTRASDDSLDPRRVITNARADHLDVMGPGPGRCRTGPWPGSTPYNAKLFTAERQRIDILRMAADDRGSTVHQTTLGGYCCPSVDEDLAPFSYAETRRKRRAGP